MSGDVRCCQQGEDWEENFTIQLVLSLFLLHCRSSPAPSCGLWLPVVETVPPDLLTLTSACVKLRMTQRPPLQTCDASVWNSSSSLHICHDWKTDKMIFWLNGLLAAEEHNQWLRGTLGVAVHSACGLQHPACKKVKEFLASQLMFLLPWKLFMFSSGFTNYFENFLKLIWREEWKRFFFYGCDQEVSFYVSEINQRNTKAKINK